MLLDTRNNKITCHLTLAAELLPQVEEEKKKKKKEHPCDSLMQPYKRLYTLLSYC